MVFTLSVLRPWCEISKFAIVPVICQPHLRAYKQDLFVVYDNAAIIDDVLMNDRPANPLQSIPIYM
jgi:hypothetical protein